MPSVVPIPDTQTDGQLPGAVRLLPKLTPRRRNLDDQKPSNPYPFTPTLSPRPSLANHIYQTPIRRILSEEDHQTFLKSATHDLIVSFVFTLSDSIRNKSIKEVASSPAVSDPTILTLLSILDSAETLLSNCPPISTGSRFGNPAFRDFLATIHLATPDWHAQLHIPSAAATDELSTYLHASFGNGSRIDYGSGHELNFLLWTLGLRQLNLLADAAFPAFALLVFPRYLRLMRAVQSTYYLEPAGSHGVWGLDDYQFLPFLFGASQLVDHRHLRPRSIHNPLVLEECSEDYLYLDQVRWVNETKTVQGLRWHSPMLDDISAAKSWAKVEAGMRRMFLAEVLGKLPVAQHFLFGSLLPAPEGMGRDAEGRMGEVQGGEGEEVRVDGMRHRHNPNSWGDCCGIKVPSAIGARQEEAKHGQQSGLRRVPFD